MTFSPSKAAENQAQQAEINTLTALLENVCSNWY